MNRTVVCAVCGKRILDNGKPWNLKGWTAVTAIGADCTLSEFHVCPDHPTWTVSGPPGSQEVRRCGRTTGAPPSWSPSW